jgi:hypothetical protein
MKSRVVPIRDKPAQVKLATVDALSGTEGIRANEAEPQLEDVTSSDALAPMSSKGPY